MLRRFVGFGAAVAVVISTLVAATAEATTIYAEPVSPTAAVVLAAPLPVAEPLGVFSTQVRWTRRSAQVTYGVRSVLEGQVVTGDGALPGVDVRLLARPVGASGWTRVGIRRTSADSGIFRFDTHLPTRTTDYRAVFGGASLYRASEASARVVVVRKISSTMSRAADGTFTMAGTVAPRYSGRTIRLQRKTCTSCAWSTVSTATTSGTSGWRFRVTGPSSRGTWSYRAVTPADTSYPLSTSMTWLVTRS